MHHTGFFFLHWAITAVSLWVATFLFRGMKFESVASLVVAALLLGFANAIVKPILVVLTLPLTFLTFGLFLLVINALMIMLVAALVRGFTVSGFGTAFMAAIFIALLSAFLGGVLLSWGPSDEVIRMPGPMHGQGVWI
jgi:putative membrane protein